MERVVACEAVPAALKYQNTSPNLGNKCMYAIFQKKAKLMFRKGKIFENLGKKV